VVPSNEGDPEARRGPNCPSLAEKVRHDGRGFMQRLLLWEPWIDLPGKPWPP